MDIDIREMNEGDKISLSFSEMLDIPSKYALLDSKIKADVSCILTKHKDYFSVKGKFSTNIKSECALCLTPVEKFLEIEMDDNFSETPDFLDSQDAFKIVSHKLDLSESVLSGLLIEIPVKFMCSDSCKGLCPSCGANLNKTICGCDNAQYDERFAKLKDFFKEV